MRPLGGVAALVASIGLVTAQSKITVDVSTKFQVIDGFGVSQAFGRAAQFESSATRQQGLDYLFSKTIGAGLTIIRNRIGSGAGDSIEPNSPGSPSATPTYVWDRNDSGQVWFSQQAMSYGVKTIYADAWSAPGFMKTNGQEANGGYLCGVSGETCSSGDWRQAYANFLTQYIKFYAQEGIPITHVGFLNEPDFTATYSSMNSDGTKAASFIPTLYNTLKSNNFGNVSITCCDSIGWPGQTTMTAQLVSAGMEQYLGAITSHAYNGDPSTPINTVVKTWETEAADLNDAWCTTWYSSGGACEGFTWAQKIHTGIVTAHLSAYLYWEGYEVNQFQASSYLVASDNTNVTPSGRLWAFAIWSRYVRPGAHRVATSGSASSVGIGAFQNVDGSVAVLLTNTGSSSQSVAISVTGGFTATGATAFVANSATGISTTSVSFSSGSATVTVPGHAVVAVVLASNGQPPSSSSTTTATTRSISTITSTTTTRSTTTITTSIQSTTTNPSSNCAAHWGQCGGNGWSGSTCCQSPYTCQSINPYYSQCL